MARVRQVQMKSHSDMLFSVERAREEVQRASDEFETFHDDTWPNGTNQVLDGLDDMESDILESASIRLFEGKTTSKEEAMKAIKEWRTRDMQKFLGFRRKR